MVLNHPKDYIQLLDEATAGSLILQFSIYTYRPKTILDERRMFHVLASEADEWFEEANANLSQGEDIAIHSKVYDSYKNDFSHIPMVDFDDSVEEGQAIAIACQINQEFGMHSALFSSGRSYHLYGYPLLSEENFPRFLGRLLLFNDERKKCVDQRWIGHRLLAGYASLRWSSNNRKYLAPPENVWYA